MVQLLCDYIQTFNTLGDQIVHAIIVFDNQDYFTLRAISRYRWRFLVHTKSSHGLPDDDDTLDAILASLESDRKEHPKLLELNYTMRKDLKCEHCGRWYRVVDDPKGKFGGLKMAYSAIKKCSEGPPMKFEPTEMLFNN